MLPDRYTKENLISAIEEPTKFKNEFDRFHGKLDKPLSNAYYQNWVGVGDGIRVMEEDWDNLIILDACRRDLFEEVADLEAFDEYRYVESADSNTTPWTVKNFTGRQFGDTVYITANPATSREAPHAFHRLIEVWDDKEAYDESTYSIPPESVIECASEAADKYPDKRLVVHFVQPHYPFIPRPDLVFRTYWRAAAYVGVNVEEKSEGPSDIWSAVKQGIASKEEAWEGYRANLEFMLSDAVGLAEDLPGKSVVSSDHGNMIGERSPFGRQIYGHPNDYRSPELIEVPWAVVDSKNRKTITDDGAESSGSMDSDIINERLNALGYV